MSTARISLSVQELSSLDMEIYSLFTYDWLLCLGEEIRFIWNWRSRGVTISSLVYAFSRYAWLIVSILPVMTMYPMSNLLQGKCMGRNCHRAFSALRAYALSNRSTWLGAMIILLAIPPGAIHISLPVLTIMGRGSQFSAELLVVGITWWYTYQSYRIRKGIKIGKSMGSFLFYNGSMYFLSLAILYIVDIIFAAQIYRTATSGGVRKVAGAFDLFIDPTVASTTYFGMGSRARERMASTLLEFGARPSNSLPPLIASFAHPVHVDESLFEIDPDQIVNDGSEVQDGEDKAGPTLQTPSSHSPTRGGISGSVLDLSM
ncbi:hypothetical protein V8D89_001222 [Ganoderma adspersum]